MKIEIDTKRDTKEDIARIIKMLQAMIGESSGWSSQETANSGEMVNLGFLDDNSSQTSSENTTAEEKKEEKPQVELY